MVHRKKPQRLMCCWLLLVFVFGSTALGAQAADQGIYLATAKPHYTHPVSGQVEDSGNNPVLGQSMTESMVYSKALIEVDTNGKMYVTLRLNLIDSVKNIAFQVQRRGESTYSSVSSSVMQENLKQNWADYRLPIPAESAIVRASVFVVPMGRDVIFYMDFSDLQAGSGDFVTSIKVAAAANPPAPASSTPAQPAQSTNTLPPSPVEPQQSANAPLPAASASLAPASTPATASSQVPEPSDAGDPAAALEESATMFAAGNEAAPVEPSLPDAATLLAAAEGLNDALSDAAAETSERAIWPGILGGLIGLAALGAVGWLAYRRFVRKKVRA
ncbi:MAG: hypothetical protein LBT32_07455 [Peptococcaceae bacterium]|jgi:hypothetical protein|nr:hypothetical protein [Peptococcaceae bacterium]